MTRQRLFWSSAALIALAGGCMGDEEIGTGSAALASVTWQNTVRVAATGSSISKTAGGVAWNAAASSVESLAADGYVEFSTAENNRAKMAGLSNGDTDASYEDIDFAIWLKSNGVIGIYEGGVLKAKNVGSYAACDVFQVRAEAGVVTYHQNGNLLYASQGTPSFPLLLDASLRDPGASVSDAAVQTFEFWQNAVGVSITSNDITNTATDNEWASGASSVESLAGDGYFEFTTHEIDTQKMVGLNSGDADQTYADIDYALFLRANGSIGVYENGALVVKNAGTYAAGDVFRLEVSGGQVNYSKNGAPIYTSLTAATGPLSADCSLRTAGATVADPILVDAI